MYAPSLFQAKYLLNNWQIPDEKYGLMNVVTVFSILASLFWSGVADRYRLHRRILVVKSILYAISYCSIWALEPFVSSWTIDFRIYVITFLIFTTTIFCSAIFPLLGTLVFAILESSPSLRDGPVPPKRLLGRQKLFGTIGIGTVYALNGCMTDLIGFRAQFLIVSVTCVLFAIVAWFGLEDNISTSKEPLIIPSSAGSKEVHPEVITASTEEKPSFWKNLCLLLKMFDFILLLFIAFLIGVIGSFFNMYMSMFMSKILGDGPATGTMIGLMNGFRMLVELPMYGFGDKLLALLGPYGVLLIGMISSTIRSFGYALVVKDQSSAKFAFIFELFKGLSHTTNAIGGCVLASDLAPASAQGTAQALFTSAHHHAASVIAGLFSSFFLSSRKNPSSSLEQQLDAYRYLFYVGGCIGCFGCIVNFTRIVIDKMGRFKHFKK